MHHHYSSELLYTCMDSTMHNHNYVIFCFQFNGGFHVKTKMYTRYHFMLCTGVHVLISAHHYSSEMLYACMVGLQCITCQFLLPV